MSDNSYACPLSGCEGSLPFTNAAAARRHRHRYHGVPVPFDYKGCQYTVTHSKNRYTCPLPDCGEDFRQRESIERHLTGDHSIHIDTKIFATPSKGERSTTSGDRLVFVLTEAVLARDLPVNLPVPAASSHQVGSIGESVPLYQIDEHLRASSLLFYSH
jgi:hypothetical protein